MREILFRGKRIDKSEWFYDSYCYAELLNKSGYEHLIIEQSAEGKSHNVVVESVGQYTGLTDKNGTKIFEGDIVTMPRYGSGKHKSFVYFKNGKFAINSSNYSFKDICPKNMEVIGNIHDNPELLKG